MGRWTWLELWIAKRKSIWQTFLFYVWLKEMLSFSCHSFQRLQLSFVNMWLPLQMLWQIAWGFSSNVGQPTRGLLISSVQSEVQYWGGFVKHNSTDYAHKYTPAVCIRAALFILHSNTHNRLSVSLWQFQTGDFSNLSCCNHRASRGDVCSAFTEFLYLFQLIIAFAPFGYDYTTLVF